MGRVAGLELRSEALDTGKKVVTVGSYFLAVVEKSYGKEWPTATVEPMPVCVLPLDNDHNIPKDVQLVTTRWQNSVARQQLEASYPSIVAVPGEGVGDGQP